MRAATLTGSGAAGHAVARKAGELLKKTVLELGGSDPYLVLEDADVETAAKVCTKARLVNSGQSCIAGKAIHRRRRDSPPVRGALRRADARRIARRSAERGNGDRPACARRLARDAAPPGRDERTKRRARVARRHAAAWRGAYYPASVLTNVRKGMPAFDEEMFGPLAAIVPVKNEEEAIAAANDSSFGLGAAIITCDVRRGEKIAAERIESGAVFVNDAVRSDQRLAFGGVKESGYGRELSAYGFKEFVNIKTVVVA